MEHEAGSPNIKKSKINTSDDNRGLFDGIKDTTENVYNQSASSIVRILTKYVTRKYADDVSIKLLIDQREIKDKVFENIFSKFTKGEKLEIYDEKRELDNMEKRA